MNTENEKNKLENRIGGLVFVGCLMLGVGIGFIKHAVHIGAVIGMGVGFIAWQLSGRITEENKVNPYIFEKKDAAFRF